MRYALLAIVSVFLVIDSVSAQNVTGNLEGRVTTRDTIPLADVKISISGPYLQGVRDVFTDARGHFRVVALPTGTYAVRVSRLGYRDVVVEDVRIQLGKTTSLGMLSLQIQAVEVDPLIISARALVIDPVSTTIGANLETEVIEEIPVERDYQSLVVLLPHANTSYYGDDLSVGGNNGLENLFYVDGVKVTTPYNATGSTRLPYNFIRQIEVKEGGYGARYSGALGATVNVITHSGSNKFEGNAFGFFTNSALAGDPRAGLVDLPERDFATYDVGIRLSGPIARDRLWFSAAYNPQFQTRDVQALNQGFFEDRRTEHRFAAKVNWRAAERTDVEASLFGDPATHHRVGPFTPLFTTAELNNPDPFLWRRENGGVNFSLRARQGLGRTAVIETLVSRSAGKQNSIGDTETARNEPYFFDFRTGTTEGGVLWHEEVREVRTAAALDATLLLGSHTVSMGGRYEENLVDFLQVTPEPGAVLQLADSLFIGVFYDNDFTVRNRIPAVYVQDLWQLTDRIAVNAGLRWDSQYLIGVGDSVAQAFENQWQPRLGLTLQPGELGTQKVFGSYGRFYLQRPLSLNTMTQFSGLKEVDSFYSTDPRDPSSTPDAVLDLTNVQEKDDGISGEYHDEFTLGYERLIGRRLRLLARGVHRVLRDSWGAGLDSLGNWTTGNPGKGDLDFLPRPKRRYSALELTAEQRGESPLYFVVSYVLSRSYGNYTGLFSSDESAAFPDNNLSFRCAEQGVNSTGLLPNDRTHVLKALGSYQFKFGLSAGAFFTWQSGTPLNEFANGPISCGGVIAPVFLVPRGSAGRTPPIWDLSLRFAYSLLPWGQKTSRLVLDILHLGNPREVVVVDQLKQVEDGVANPTFGAALVHQPEMMVRLGVEIGL